MRVAVGSVVYKSALIYFDEFIESIVKQSMDCFDVILINDDINRSELENGLKKYKERFNGKIIVIEGKDGAAPYELRIQLLEAAYENQYDLLVLCDADDRFSENRVKRICESYDRNIAFYYNELQTFSGDAVMPDLPSEITSVQGIGEYNFLGLSNTAVNMKEISLEFIESLQEGNTQIFDWYLFARLLLDKKVGKKIIDCYTYYRIHENNLAGISEYTIDNINTEIQIKLAHYKLLKHYSKYFEQLYELYMKEKKNHGSAKLLTTNHYWWGILQLTGESRD